jgi:hypothetical protein
MPKADMQRRHFEQSVGMIRLLMSPPVHVHSSPTDGRSPSRFIYNKRPREAV